MASISVYLENAAIIAALSFCAARPVSGNFDARQLETILRRGSFARQHIENLKRALAAHMIDLNTDSDV